MVNRLIHSEVKRWYFFPAVRSLKDIWWEAFTVVVNNRQLIHHKFTISPFQEYEVNE